MLECQLAILRPIVGVEASKDPPTPAPTAPPATSAKADCEAKAVSKDGKPLAGAAKTAFMKKCEKDAAAKK